MTIILEVILATLQLITAGGMLYVLFTIKKDNQQLFQEQRTQQQFTMMTGSYHGQPMMTTSSSMYYQPIVETKIMPVLYQTTRPEVDESVRELEPTL